MANKGTVDKSKLVECDQYQCDTCKDVIAMVNPVSGMEPLSGKGECGRCAAVTNEKKLDVVRAGLIAFEEHAERLMKQMAGTRVAELTAGNGQRAVDVERIMGSLKLLYGNYIENTAKWRKAL